MNTGWIRQIDVLRRIGYGIGISQVDGAWVIRPFLKPEAEAYRQPGGIASPRRLESTCFANLVVVDIICEVVQIVYVNDNLLVGVVGIKYKSISSAS